MYIHYIHVCFFLKKKKHVISYLRTAAQTHKSPKIILLWGNWAPKKASAGEGRRCPDLSRKHKPCKSLRTSFSGSKKARQLKLQMFHDFS